MLLATKDALIYSVATFFIYLFFACKDAHIFSKKDNAPIKNIGTVGQIQ
jgi:hypothetical protein